MLMIRLILNIKKIAPKYNVKIQANETVQLFKLLNITKTGVELTSAENIWREGGKSNMAATHSVQISKTAANFQIIRLPSLYDEYLINQTFYRLFDGWTLPTYSITFIFNLIFPGNDISNVFFQITQSVRFANQSRESKVFKYKALDHAIYTTWWLTQERLTETG